METSGASSSTSKAPDGPVSHDVDIAQGPDVLLSDGCLMSDDDTGVSRPGASDASASVAGRVIRAQSGSSKSRSVASRSVTSRTVVGPHPTGDTRVPLPNARHALSARELELDAFVRVLHRRLALAGLAVYGVEFVVGFVVAAVDFTREENEILRVFHGFRLLSYAVLAYATAVLLSDYEPAHPALHVTATAVWVLVVVAVISSSADDPWTLLSAWCLATACIDAGLIAVTSLVLRHARNIVDRLVASGEIHSIHKVTQRYLDLIPHASTEADPRSARELLWESVRVFDSSHLRSEALLHQREQQQQAATFAAG